MVFVLPMEFKAPADDEDSEGPAMVQLALDPVQATFDKLEEKERRHLRPLYIKGHVDGRPMTKMMVDGGAAVNVMPYATYRKLGMGEE
jgi:predicted aspartyl protease